METVGRRINAERVVILSWPRAILMQLAHPLIAAGVLGHSSYRGSPTQAAARLHHTLRAMLALTFGDEERRLGAINRIRDIHTRVNGRLRDSVGPFAAGTPYSAEDPQLLLWVHATMIDSTVDLYERVVMPLTAAERDDYCAEGIPLLAALGGDADSAPKTWTDLQHYMRGVEQSGHLVAAPETLELAHAVVRTNRWLTIGLLTEPMRAVYGFSWNPRKAARFSRAVAALAAARQATPDVLATWRDARRISRKNFSKIGAN